MNRSAPKLLCRFPLESSLSTGVTFEPAQLSYVNGDAPGGVFGFAPQRVATHTDSPSLSIATAFSAPQLLPDGRLPHGAVVAYGLGRSLLGGVPSSARSAHVHQLTAQAMSAKALNLLAGAISCSVSVAGQEDKPKPALPFAGPVRPHSATSYIIQPALRSSMRSSVGVPCGALQRRDARAATAPRPLPNAHPAEQRRRLLLARARDSGRDPV